MGQIFANMSMSLDGYIAGPNVRVGNGMGDRGDDLFTEAEDRSLAFAATGDVDERGVTHLRCRVGARSG